MPESDSENNKIECTEMDVMRVMFNIAHISVEEWMKREKIPITTVVAVIDSNIEAMDGRIKQGEIDDLRSAIPGCLAAVFMTGWECGREYGRRN